MDAVYMFIAMSTFFSANSIIWVEGKLFLLMILGSVWLSVLLPAELVITDMFLMFLFVIVV